MKRVGSREVWSLSEITRAVARRFEDVPSIWVEAEVQDLRRRRASVRFRLVDDHSLEASMNEIVFDRLAHRPADGARVHAYGRVGFYARNASVSMRVERMDLVGEGLLRAQVEELLARLRAEGLLAPERKRALPLLPRRIGVVTSGSGAARHDIERAVFGRYPEADLLLVDSPVQGDAAPTAIARAVAYLDGRADIDVIVVARGGGSIEDLMAFNSEVVCRAVAACATPVVSAVGHESDTTVCDEVADLRAATPTAAGEIVVPDIALVNERLGLAAATLARRLVLAHDRGRERVATASRAIGAALRGRGARAEDRLAALSSRLVGAARREVAAAPPVVDERRQSLSRAWAARRGEAAARTDRAAAVLSVLSPELTVRRGYAIVRDGADGRVLSRMEGIVGGQSLRLQLADGELSATAEDRG